MIEFHYLNVGHGDTTVIQLPDNELMVVDINRSRVFDDETAEEIAQECGIDLGLIERAGADLMEALQEHYDVPLDDPLAYLQENFEQDHIFRYVQSHPDMDHLAGFSVLSNQYEFTNFWDTDHSNISKDDFRTDEDKEDWEFYLELRDNDRLCLYRGGTAIQPSNAQYPYSLYVFHPTRDALEEGDSDSNPLPNLFSYLLLVDYNGCKTVLGGDVPEAYWKDLWEWLDDNSGAKDLFKGIHTLKASHHGRKSGRCGWTTDQSYCRDFLNWMDPELVVVSVGKKPENCDATEWYRRRPDGTSRSVWTTRWRGTISVSYDGTLPYDKSKVEVEARYDRTEKKDHVEEPDVPYVHIGYKFKIGAKLSSTEHGQFREEYKSNARRLPKGMWLKFYIKSASNVPEPYEVKWRVVNTGEEARIAGDLRGKLETGESIRIKKEQAKYKGTHHMDCFAISDGCCVARDRFFVNIR